MPGSARTAVVQARAARRLRRVRRRITFEAAWSKTTRLDLSRQLAPITGFVTLAVALEGKCSLVQVNHSQGGQVWHKERIAT